MLYDFFICVRIIFSYQAEQALIVSLRLGGLFLDETEFDLAKNHSKVALRQVEVLPKKILEFVLIVFLKIFKDFFYQENFKRLRA